MAPVLSFTAEEVFGYVPAALRPDVISVFALPATDAPAFTLDTTARAAWEKLLAVRSETTKAIEPLRKSGEVGHSLDTHVTLFADPSLKATLEGLGSDLRAMFIVSRLEVMDLADAPADAWTSEELPELKVTVRKAEGEKCERCWIISADLGTDAAHPTLCPRCTAVLTGTGA
jgi:isoleucyl-tRNA synthetase